MKLTLLFLALSVFLATTLPVGAAEIVALVIGNNEYLRDEDQLDTPINDAQLMKATLEALPGGADVKILTDAKKEDIEIALNSLKARSIGAKLALVFYSGHGTEDQPTGFSQSETFLLPVDAYIPDVNYLPTRAVSLSAVLAALKAAPVTARAVILDCCRSGAPRALGALASSTKSFGDLDERVKAALGKAVVPDATLVAFAASPGRKAAAFLNNTDTNSPFTKFLTDQMRTGTGNLRDLVEAAAEITEKATARHQVPYVTYSGAPSAIREIVFRKAQSSVEVPVGPMSPGVDTTISITTKPKACFVLLDGEEIGLTPLFKHKVTSGLHKVRLVRAGYIDLIKDINVDFGQSLSLEDMELQRAVGVLRVESDPKGLDYKLVLIESPVPAEVGENAFSSSGMVPITLKQVPTGTYRVCVSRPGHIEVNKSVTITAAEPATLLFEFGPATLLGKSQEKPLRSAVDGISDADIPLFFRRKMFNKGDLSGVRKDGKQYYILSGPYESSLYEVTQDSERTLAKGQSKYEILDELDDQDLATFLAVRCFEMWIERDGLESVQNRIMNRVEFSRTEMNAIKKLNIRHPAAFKIVDR
jgi:uncharacterized caspase-like protein